MFMYKMQCDMILIIYDLFSIHYWQLLCVKIKRKYHYCKNSIFFIYMGYHNYNNTNLNKYYIHVIWSFTFRVMMIFTSQSFWWKCSSLMVYAFIGSMLLETIFKHFHTIKKNHKKNSFEKKKLFKILWRVVLKLQFMMKAFLFNYN